MLRKRRFLSITFLSMALVACGHGPAAPAYQGIQGTLSIGLAAEGLAGAQVEALDAGGAVVAQTHTDASGHFALALPVGSYTVLSPGQTLQSAVYQGGSGAVPFASSQVVGVGVAAGSTTPLEMLQLPAAAGSNATTPPTASVSGLNAASLDARGTADFTVTADSAGGNSLYRVYAAFGKVPVRLLLGANDRALLISAGPSGEPSPTYHAEKAASLNLAQYAAGLSGSTTLDLLVLDSNMNRSVYLYPVTLINTPSGGALSAVQGVYSVAYTVANARVTELSAPAGSGALVYSEVSWTPYTFAQTPTADTPALNQGYHIYRSQNGGPETLVGTKTVYEGTGTDGKPTLINPDRWQDTDPLLSPGVKVSYTVRAFSGTRESPDSAASAATALPVLTVSLTAPAEQAQNVSVTPTFSWTTNGVGSYEYFVPALSDTVNGEGDSFCGVAPTANPENALVDYLQGATLKTGGRGFYFNNTPCGVVGGKVAGSYSFSYQPGTSYSATLPPLQAARSYQWRLIEGVAVDDPNTPHALSVSSDAAGLLFAFNIYDTVTYEGDQVFTFTTGGNP